MNYEKYKKKIEAIHGDKYDYTATVFNTLEDKVEVRCPLHGIFSIVLNNHLKKSKFNGCRTCSYISVLEETNRSKFNNTLDLSSIHFSNTTTNISSSTVHNILCKKHNITFNQKYVIFNKGFYGCKSCSLDHKVKVSKEDLFTVFKTKANKIHNSKYKYTGTYINSHTPISIICEVHGEFQQLPYIHLQGSGCSLCAPSKPRNTTQEFIDKAIEVHGTKYDYSSTVYSQSREKLNIVCTTHGIFSQKANNHLQGEGCPTCGLDTVSEKLKLSLDQVRDIVKPYVLLSEDYKNVNQKLKLECVEHGSFSMSVKQIQNSSVCPLCKPKHSPLSEILDFIKKQTSEIVLTDSRPKCMKGLELDLYIPSLNVAIEYNGSTFHHSSNSKEVPEYYRKYYKHSKYHYDKWKLCMGNGITLLSIYDFYWLNTKKQEIYKSKITHLINKDTKIFARKCKIVEVDNKEAYQFYEDNHLEGSGFNYKDSKSYCLELNSIRYMYCTIGKMYNQTSKCFEYKLHRICTLKFHTVVGGVSKLSKFMKTNFGTYKFQLTLSSGGTIPDLDLSKVSLRYFWVKPGGSVYYHRNKTQKQNLEKTFKQPLLQSDTENSYMERLGFLKVYDNGVTSTNI